ncbi:MAG: geranylgeranyl reductase family protein [Candidatus Baldrarchaeia archaeon]
MSKYDVIVVGAGTGGTMAAKNSAKGGLKVLLIDKKPRDKIGDKVCGDAIGRHHFDNLGLSYPKGDELESVFEGIEVYSPDLETVFKIKGERLEGFGVNRYLFGQRLLRDALDAGAELMDNANVIKPVIKENFVKGVVVKNGNETKEVEANIVIDASGVTGVIRKRLPSEFGVEREILQEDLIVAYREIRELKELGENPNYAKIYLTQRVAPGGYYWIFPKKNGIIVNVGIGVQSGPNAPSPKRQLYEYVLNRELFRDSKIIHGGGGAVPTRRPLDCLTGNGVMFVGDAAFQVNPVHGGGIGPSMTAGKIAGEVAIEALEKDDVSREGLWDYNVRFMKEYGAKQAGLDIFRWFLQKLSDDELNWGMKHKLVTEQDVLKANLGEDLKLNITEKAIRFFRGIRKLSFLQKLREVASTMKTVKQLYRNYPTPEEFENWRNEVHRIFMEFKKKT